jgi:transposase
VVQRERDVIGGVDTHQDVHVVAAVDSRGKLLGSDVFAATASGYSALLRWLNRHGKIVAVGVEGTGAYGAGLCQHLLSQGVHVVEVNRPNRQLRRQRGKSDPIDAEAAARAVAAGHATGLPKSANGAVEAIRLLRVAHRGSVKARTQAGAQLRTVVTTTPEPVRSRLRGLTTRRLAIRTARFHASSPATTPGAAAKMALASIAHRWLALDAEVETLKRELCVLVEAVAPTLVAKPGLGVDTAGALLVATGDNPDRLRSEAAFAAMCGVSPVAASSGKVVRHRLNRGGNRTANCALFRIVLIRLKNDATTRAYYDRRAAEGLRGREVIRCLKRYVAREVYAAITADLGGPKSRGISAAVSSPGPSAEAAV